MTHQEIKKVLGNKYTKQLVEFVDSTRQTNKMMISPQFFHKTHSNRDREVIVKLLLNFYDNKIVIKRTGNDAVFIDFSTL